MSQGRIKVAIVGGGCASVATAFELSRPEHEGRFEVTVYQLGWRLGGKGASGRGPADRIEEHGLHLWMGFYENAFRLMRECYAELGRDPKRHPMASWEDAFVPDHVSGVADRSPGGRWSPWMVHFPPQSGMPGDPGPARSWTPADYLARCVTLLRSLFDAIRVRTGGAPAPAFRAEEAGAMLARLASYTELAALGGIVEYLNMLDTAVRALPRYPGEMVLRFHDALVRAARSQIETIVDKDDEVRRLWEIVDLVLAVVRGMVRDGLLTDPRGFDAINHLDCREWLSKHGASARSVNSAFVRALYDLAFAYEDGDRRGRASPPGRRFAARVRAFFTYRGAFFWKMQAGMGDVVFAPFYEVLKRRGVRFEFFHRLENVAAGAHAGEPPDVDGAGFRRPGPDCRTGASTSRSSTCTGCPAGPRSPTGAQLVGGARMKREGWQFEVPLGSAARGPQDDCGWAATSTTSCSASGVGAVPHVCGELIARQPRMADDGRAGQVGADPGVPALDERRHGAISGGRVRRRTSRVSSSRSTPGPTCGS